MLHHASPPNRRRRPRRYASDADGRDLALLLVLLALFLLMAAIALTVLGVVPLP